MATLVVALTACSPQPSPTAADPAAACDLGATLLEVAQGEMDPTLLPRDLVAVVPKGLFIPRRGDIVVIDWMGWTGDPGPNAPMRLIALGGDRVELRGGKVVLNGSVIDDGHGATNPFEGQPAAWIVPNGSGFVLGDARNAAADSRSMYGFVPMDVLIGRVIFRCGPPDRRGPVS